MFVGLGPRHWFTVNPGPNPHPAISWVLAWDQSGFRAKPGLPTPAHGSWPGIRFVPAKPATRLPPEQDQHPKKPLPIQRVCDVRSGSDPTWTLTARSSFPDDPLRWALWPAGLSPGSAKVAIKAAAGPPGGLTVSQTGDASRHLGGSDVSVELGRRQAPMT